jgi:endonuclease/exonuclease/phosphatase family metal-dependent hydrolase
VKWLVGLLPLTACSLELGPDATWVDADELTGDFSAELVSPAEATRPVPTRLRITTFNVEKGADIDGLVRAMTATPDLATTDVLLVQEIESHPEEGTSRASRLAAALNMGYVYAPERLQSGGTHGTAIFSHWPLEHVQVMRLPYADLAVSKAPRIALGADVRVGAFVLRVIDTHLDTRLNISDRILQLRPAVLDAPVPALVGGDFNTNPYAWVGDSVPQVPTGSIVDTDQAPALDDYMRHIDYATPTSALGPTVVFEGVVDARLDAIYTRGIESEPGAVERSVTISDHFPMFIDVLLP